MKMRNYGKKWQSKGKKGIFIRSAYSLIKYHLNITVQINNIYCFSSMRKGITWWKHPKTAFVIKPIFKVMQNWCDILHFTVWPCMPNSVLINHHWATHKHTQVFVLKNWLHCFTVVLICQTLASQTMIMQTQKTHKPYWILVIYRSSI